MIATTLMTFLFQAPASTITVDLVGSWDRFTKSYPLKRDKRTGPGHWRGCHTFTNITCDGDSLDVSSSRDGGLKMGGTYWYFYRLDGDVEHYNPVEPSTNRCPFLPGQQVNILEVPVQAMEPQHRSGSSDSMGLDVYTLDPESKYIRPKPSVRRNPLHSSLIDVDTTSTTARLDGGFPGTVRALDGKGPSSVVYQLGANSSSLALSTRKPHSSGSPTKRMLFAAFCKMRATRSAGFMGGSGLRSQPRATPPTPKRSTSEKYAQMKSLAPTTNDVDGPAATFSVTNAAPALTPSNVEKQNGGLVVQVLDRSTPNEQSSSLSSKFSIDEAAHSVATKKHARTSNVSPYVTSLEPLREDHAVSEELSANARRISSASATVETRSIVNRRQTDVVDVLVTPGVDDGSTHPDDEIYYSAPSGSDLDTSSYITNNLFSPGLAPGSVNTDGMSPYHLSQPDTPCISELGGDFLESGPLSDSALHVTLSNVRGPNHVHLDSTANLHETEFSSIEGFQGYALPETEQASALTLRKFPSRTLESRGAGSAFGKQSSTDLVHSWNDGSKHRITALEELVDDLGYLGQLII
ncbi:hypothetical protein MMC07_006420 [Pseudocyphellaria aurata]|nr:hypothetical protein [Pseudocyphellaria aurata]